MSTEKKTKIEQHKYLLHQTSENLFQIVESVGYQCPNFDKASQKIENIYKLTQFSRYDDDDDVDELKSRLSDIEYESSGFADEIEDLREAIVQVRQWGQEWKEFAKRLIEENDIDLEKYI